MQHPPEQLLDAVDNLSEFHREHEKYYSEAPLHDAVAFQRISRTLKALAERWSVVEPSDGGPRVPFAGAPDLNDPRAIETMGVLFMEGADPPAEIVQMRVDLDSAAAGYEQTAEWLGDAMGTAWSVAEGLLAFPELADLLGERHRIIAEDSLNAALAGLIARNLRRAGVLLDRVDFSPGALRADLAGARTAPPYLYSASELIDHAADLMAESATIVHGNERRWRVFRARVEALRAADRNP